MKKVFFLSMLCITAIASSSFVSIKLPPVSFHAVGSIVSSVTIFTCSGDLVEFPQFTYTYDVRGVNNNNISMAHGTETYTGTGVSVNTGEVYTLNDSRKFHQKFPIVNGAVVFREKINGILTGDQGSVDNFTVTNSFTINANGTVTNQNFNFTSDCQ